MVSNMIYLLTVFYDTFIAFGRKKAYSLSQFKDLEKKIDRVYIVLWNLFLSLFSCQLFILFTDCMELKQKLYLSWFPSISVTVNITTVQCTPVWLMSSLVPPHPVPEGFRHVPEKTLQLMIIKGSVKFDIFGFFYTQLSYISKM